MHAPPSLPDLSAVPSDHLTGHVWVQELIDGGTLRFQVAEAGYLRFGDDERAFEEPPLGLAAATRHVGETFALPEYLDTVDEPERYTFLAVATRRQGIDYDWGRLPPALGTAIHDDHEDRWLPPDRVAGVFDRLGPAPVNTVERELSVERHDLSGYEVPDSAWYDGPAAGVVFADKHGRRAVLESPGWPEPPEPLHGATAPELVERFLTDDLLRRVADAGVDRGPEALFERALERLFRERYAWLVDDSPVVDPGAFRSAAAERVRRWYDDHAG